jgi:hypothetical protein
MARKKSSKPLESANENKAVKALAILGWKSYKQNGMGRASRPDRLFLGTKGRHVFVEFKREGEVPTSLQNDELEELFRMGHSVAVCVHTQDVTEFLAQAEKFQKRHGNRVALFWRYWEDRGYAP